ncbi:uncharacterized protein CBL_20615 [Carabus blaptoides fortunei]
MKNEIVYEIHDSEEYLTCLNNDDEISKMQQQSEIKYFSNVLGNELTVFEATDDESMAVQALRQLGSMYSSNTTVLLPEQNAKNYDTKFNKTPCKKPPPFTCSYCSAHFDTGPEYNSHLMCHQKFVCKFCAESFIALTELRKHITEHHPGDRPYKCHVCLQHFPRPSSLTNHLKIHNYQPGRALLVAASKSVVPKQQLSSNSNTTPIMKQQVNSNNATVAKQHVNSAMSVLKFENIDAIQPWPVEQLYLPDVTVNNTSVTDTDPLATGNSCQFTANSFDSTSEITVSGGAAFTTQDNQFNNTSDPGGPGVKVELVLPYDNKHEAFPISCVPQMEITVKSDVEMKPYVCSECGEAYGSEKSLVTHRKLHTTAAQYVCDVCSTVFDSEVLRSKHRQHCNANGDTLYVTMRDTVPCKKSVMKLKHACPDCEKQFATKQKMFRHMWIHRKKSYACEHCQRTFELQQDLDKHRLSVHPADSPYVCQECGKSFASRQGLWEHGRLHGGGPGGTFTCTKCQKSFASRQGYLIHNRIHTGERPYGCRYCLKAFRDGGTLRKHERIHTGERPHVCPICKHDFNQKVVLREHVRWVHAATVAAKSPASFACQVCNITVGDREELCAHLVRHSDQSRQNTATAATMSHQRKNKKQKVANIATTTQCNQQQASNECDLCGNKFTSHEDLMTHVHVHI